MRSLPLEESNATPWGTWVAGRPFVFGERSRVSLTKEEVLAATSTVFAALSRWELALPPELKSAADAGHIRLVFAAFMPRQPLPSDWCVPLESAEEVVLAVARLPLDLPCAGFVAVVTPRSVLPMAALDDDIREQIATALADVLVGELER